MNTLSVFDWCLYADIDHTDVVRTVNLRFSKVVAQSTAVAKFALALHQKSADSITGSP